MGVIIQASHVNLSQEGVINVLRWVTWHLFATAGMKERKVRSIIYVHLNHVMMPLEIMRKLRKKLNDAQSVNL